MIDFGRVLAIVKALNGERVDFGIDFVSRLGEAFAYRDLQGETQEIEGVPVRVVTPRTLYRMKRDTVRHQDKLDAMKLREKFGLEE